MKPVETLDLNTLGGQVTFRRQTAGLTLRELGKRSGINWVTIHEIEVGKTPNPRIRTVQALAAALDVPVTWLIGMPSDPGVGR